MRKRYQMMSDKFPTGSLAVIDFDVARWSDVGPGEGELELFVRPKDLVVDAG
jgi:phosphohistidine phosphatase